MTNATATFIGLFLCMGVPGLSFLAGVGYAKYGLPFQIRWGWRKEEEEE